jgi:hypothetical protein
MRRSMFKVTFLAVTVLSVGGWIWLLGVGIKWLIDKL